MVLPVAVNTVTNGGYYKDLLFRGKGKACWWLVFGRRYARMDGPGGARAVRFSLKALHGGFKLGGCLP